MYQTNHHYGWIEILQGQHWMDLTEIIVTGTILNGLGQLSQLTELLQVTLWEFRAAVPNWPFIDSLAWNIGVFHSYVKWRVVTYWLWSSQNQLSDYDPARNSQTDGTQRYPGEHQTSWWTSGVVHPHKSIQIGYQPGLDWSQRVCPDKGGYRILYGISTTGTTRPGFNHGSKYPLKSQDIQCSSN